MSLKETYIDLPCVTSIDGREKRGAIKVYKNKPPKLRFKPKTRVIYEGDEYEIAYVYRCMPESQEWVYVLEDRGPKSKHGDVMSGLLKAMDAGKSTPRLVCDIFKHPRDVHDFFVDIPSDGDRTHVYNKDILAKATVKPVAEILEELRK